jgi:adenylate cyclase
LLPGSVLFLPVILLTALFLTWAGYSSVQAQEAIVLSDNDTMNYLDGHVGVFKETGGHLTLDDILDDPEQYVFQEVEGSSFNFGFSKSVIWLRFRVHNPFSEEQLRMLEIAYPMLDNIQFFVQSKDVTSFYQVGDMLPFHSRQENFRNFLLNLHLAPLFTTTCYLRIQSSSSLSIPLALWSSKPLQQRIRHENLLLGICYGAILMMVLYHFLLFLVLRFREYLYFILFIASGGLFVFTLNGFSFQYLWPDWIWWANSCLPILIFFSSIFCVYFVRSFLETAQEIPRVDQYLHFYILINGVLLLIALFVPYRMIIPVATLCGLATALISLAVAIYLVMRQRQAIFYLSAWLPLLLGIMIYSSKSFGVLPSNVFTEYAMNLGVMPMLALLSLGVADRINTIRKNAFEEQRLLTQSFERFVPKRFLNLLGKESITDVRLGDNVLKDMSVLFTDIRSFTSMSERMTPQENFQFLNAYLQRVDPVVVAHNGVVDKYIGDAVMALFETADDAVEAALEMLLKLEEFNVERVRDQEEPIRVGIGINSGELMLGTIGAAGRMEGTVISDAVNLASRIEGLTKRFKTSLLISDGCRSRLVHPERFTLKSFEAVHVRGKREVITVWEVLPG